MGIYNASHSIRPFTRKIYRKTPGVSIRREGNRPKGIYKTMKRKTIAPVKINTHRVKTVLNKNETRRRKKAKRKMRIWRDIVALINTEEIRDNVGIQLNEETGEFVSSEKGEPIIDAQYTALIEELENNLEPNDDEYEQKIINKAIRLVKKAREANSKPREMAE